MYTNLVDRNSTAQCLPMYTDKRETVREKLALIPDTVVDEKRCNEPMMTMHENILLLKIFHQRWYPKRKRRRHSALGR